MLKLDIQGTSLEVTEQATLKIFLKEEENVISFTTPTDYDDFTFEIQIIRREIAP